MKNKKRVISLGFIVLLIGGAYLLWHTKKQDDAKKHAEDTYRRMTEMAKKSAVSGLPQMARALNRYHKDNQNYPPTLEALYPKYIQGKPFIDEVPWQYQRRGNNFLLSKSIVHRGQTLVASIDNTLKPSTGSRVMLAASQPSAPKTAPSPLPDKPAVSKATMEEKAVDPKNASMTPLTFSDLYKKITTFKQMKTPPKESPEEIEEARPLDASQAASDALASLSQRYLVWKDKGGHIGFGDVQYPDKLVVDSICVDGRWEKYSD
jgi:hypothetical protein